MRKLIPVAVVATIGVSLATIPAFAATKTISVRDNSFSPKSTTVKRNTVIRFTWRGSNPHNVISTSARKIKPIATRTSGSVSRKLTKKGTYRMLCSIHEGMTLKITVK
jgi:plastocyanin